MFPRGIERIVECLNANTYRVSGKFQQTVIASAVTRVMWVPLDLGLSLSMWLTIIGVMLLGVAFGWYVDRIAPQLQRLQQQQKVEQRHV